MIFPIQKNIPFEFDSSSNLDTLIHESPITLGPLHIAICKDLEFTSEHQCPVIKPYLGEIPEHLESVHRLSKKSITYLQMCCGTFFTPDTNFERFWTHPYKYLSLLRKLQSVVSPDFSIYTDMLLFQKLWNSFRNKLMTAFYQYHRIPMIPAPSWGDMKHIDLYMEGWPRGSIIAINSTGVGRDRRNRHSWLDGYYAMLDILKPIFILRYGAMIEGENIAISKFYPNNNKQTNRQLWVLTHHTVSHKVACLSTSAPTQIPNIVSTVIRSSSLRKTRIS